MQEPLVTISLSDYEELRKASAKAQDALQAYELYGYWTKTQLTEEIAKAGFDIRVMPTSIQQRLYGVCSYFLKEWGIINHG